MKSQIFKDKIPIEMLFSLLELGTTIKQTDQQDDQQDDPQTDHKNYYIINKILFKKLQYNSHINTFIDKIAQYYFLSKQFYVTRVINYNNFLTIIRQICKINDTKFDKKIIYTKNNYDIIYYIYV